uniref:Uncharacterized protein n=1 Tax=Varanus komodoensis TaxID=61221 RepID=A0A8D2LKF3_VARKO
MKRMISLRDQRIKEKDRVKAKAKKKEDPSAIKEREPVTSCLAQLRRWTKDTSEH